MRSFAALALAGSLAFVGGQQMHSIGLWTHAVQEMLTLGRFGEWRRCMYGYTKGDTIHIRELLPEGPTGCPTWGVDSIPSMGIMEPLATPESPCAFTVAEAAAAQIRSHGLPFDTYRVRWCGLWEFNVIRFVRSTSTRTS